MQHNFKNLPIMFAAAAMLCDDTPGAAGGGTAATGTEETKNKDKVPKILPAPPIPQGMKGAVFHFRKEKLKDEAGNEIGAEYKHPSITVPLPVPTKDEVLAIMSAASDPNVEGNRVSEQKFILDLIEEAFYAQAREQINEYRGRDDYDRKEFVTADKAIDYSKLSITALANMPASERGNKVSDEDLEDFVKEYAAIMPAALGKEVRKIQNQCKLLEKGLRSVKTDKGVLKAMKDNIDVFITAVGDNVVEYMPVIDMFQGRIKKWLEATPRNVLADID